MMHPSSAASEVTFRGSGETTRAAKPASARISTVERVREKMASLGCERVWARGAGSQVLIGLRGHDAYARLTPVRESLFGLAFHDEESPADAPSGRGWHPLILVDTLEDLVEHALIAEGALPLATDA